MEGAIVLDPMMGGGTSLHEAIRLGANVIGFDVDPIPVVQAKASLSTTELPLLEQAYGALYDGLNEHLAPLHTTPCPKCAQLSPMRFMLYGQKRHCACEDVIVVDSLLLREESDGGQIRLCQNCHAIIPKDGICECPQKGAESRLVVKHVRNCLDCGENYQESVDSLFFERYAPIAVMSDCREHGPQFGSIGEHNRDLIDIADRRRALVHFDESLEIFDGPKSATLLRRGITSYAELYSSRQILYLRKAIDLLQEMDQPARRFLSLLVSTSLEFNSMLCGYKGTKRRRAGAIRHAFSHHAFSLPYTALEANPVFPARASGTLQKLFNDRIEKARRWSLEPKERILGTKTAKFKVVKGEVDQGVEVFSPSELMSGSRQFLVKQTSAGAMPLDDGVVDFIVTDPPYYDSIQYADLSAYFRVWLKQMLDGEEGDEINWDYGPVANVQRTSAERGASLRAEHYLEKMSQIFLECRRVLKDGSGRLAFTFHHWDHNAWSSLTKSLMRAGFGLLEFHVVHSENPSSVHIANMRALTDDAILILAPSEEMAMISWRKPKKIDYSSSAGFCRDCAKLLGWMLSSEIDEGQIGQLWKQLLVAR